MGGGVSDAITRVAGGGGTEAVAGARLVLVDLGGLPRRRALAEQRSGRLRPVARSVSQMRRISA